MARIQTIEAGRRRLLLGATLSIGVVFLLLQIDSGPVSLAEQHVHLAPEPDRVYQQMTTFSPGPLIVERGENQVIAEFPITVGRYHVTTRERITMDPNQRRLTFEQLRSPFFSVRTAREVFELSTSPTGGTDLSVHGTLWPQWGIVGGLVTRWLVRPYWDRIEANHLEHLRQPGATPNNQGD
ncbi:MAG TPA: hypothetical protein VNL16_10145 [Chloroflexota bacterium]|nr:hypothetical protein [Chloroflexota bacterium]